MQNTQEINWLLEFFRIGIPSLIALVVPIITGWVIARKMKDYEANHSADLKSFENVLNKRLEDYKSGISKDLYQFQTKFSLFHQKEADAIAKLYEILIDLEKILVHTIYKGGEQKRTSTRQAQDKYHEYIDFYLKNQIYFDDELCENIKEVRGLLAEMVDQYISSDTFSKVSEFDSEAIRIKGEVGKNELETHKKFRVEFPKLKNELRNKFRQLLSTEN